MNKMFKKNIEMKNRLYYLVFIIGFLTVSSCSNQEEHKEATASVFDQEPISVSTKIAGRQQSTTGTVLSGNIISKDQATVSARMSGYVKSLKVKVGDKVLKGQTILSLNSQELPAKRAQAQAGVKQAEAGLENVKVNYDRMEALWEKSSITRKEWDDISTQYKMAQAKLEGAQQMYNEVNQILGLTNVKSPISGVVTNKMINDGDLVNPGTPLLTVENDKSFEVLTYVSDYQLAHVKKGIKVTCEIKALNKNVSAVITEVAPSASNTGGQYAVKASLNLDKEDLQKVSSGMYTNVIVDLPMDSASKTICVSKSALFERGQLTGVYTISKQNTALLRWVRLGKDLGDRFEVVSGLQDGEKYIIDTPVGLVDGIPVIE
jgi:RND family efflux transporter MFP subunit